MSFPSRLFFLLCVGTLLLAGGTVVTAGIDEPILNADQRTNGSADLVDVSNSTNYLSPDADNVTRQNYQGAALDVAGAVQGDTIRLHGEQREQVLQERLENADENDTVELDTVRALERQAQTLEQQERQLYRDYSEERIDTARLFREAVRLGVTAEQYRDISGIVQDQDISPSTVDLRYSNLDGELSLLPSPLVTHIESELATGGQTPIYVQGGNGSLVLATVEGDTYLREAMVLDRRDRDAPEKFGTGGQSEADDAYTRGEQLYPWTVEDAESPEIRGFGNTSVYRLQASHTHGELRTYMDGATTDPFYEVQEKNPFEVPVTDFTQTTNEGLRLDIQLTNPTGPMRIEVIDTGNLEYDNITVSVGDNSVATLSSGTDFYTVQPVGTFEVSAETDTGERVSIHLFPE